MVYVINISTVRERKKQLDLDKVVAGVKRKLFLLVARSILLK